jgi:hypothetical protein
MHTGMIKWIVHIIIWVFRYFWYVGLGILQNTGLSILPVTHIYIYIYIYLYVTGNFNIWLMPTLSGYSGH